MKLRLNPYYNWIILLSFVGLFVLLYIFILDDHLYFMGDDFAQYIQHARNIYHGDPYSNLPYPFNPEAQIGPPAYPPLYPFLISPFTSGEDPVIWMKVLTIIIFTLSLVILYKFFVSLKENSLILEAIFVFASLPWIFLDAGYLGSDIPYAFFSFLALWSLITLPNDRPAGIHSIMTGLLMAMSTLTRDIGISLWASSLLYLSQKIWKNLSFRSVYLIQMILLSLAFLLPLFAWKFYENHLGLGPANAVYFKTALNLDHFTFFGFLTRLGSNLFYHIKNGYDLIFPLSFIIRPIPSLDWVRFPITFLILGILCWQILKGFRSSWLPIVLYLGCYLGVLLIMNSHISRNGPRMLLPLAPFLVLFILKGVKEISIKRLGIFPPITYKIFFIFWIGFNMVGSFNLYSFFRNAENLSFSPQGLDYQNMATYIRQEIPVAGRIAYIKPRYLSLYSGHPTAILPFMGPPSLVGPPSNILDYLSHWRITHVLLDDHFKREEYVTRQTINQFPRSFSTVYTCPHLTLLRFIDPVHSLKNIHHPSGRN